MYVCLYSRVGSVLRRPTTDARRWPGALVGGATPALRLAAPALLTRPPGILTLHMHVHVGLRHCAVRRRQLADVSARILCAHVVQQQDVLVGLRRGGGQLAVLAAPVKLLQVVVPYSLLNAEVMTDFVMVLVCKCNLYSVGYRWTANVH